MELEGPARGRQGRVTAPLAGCLRRYKDLSEPEFNAARPTASTLSAIPASSWPAQNCYQCLPPLVPALTEYGHLQQLHRRQPCPGHICGLSGSLAAPIVNITRDFVEKAQKIGLFLMRQDGQHSLFGLRKLRHDLIVDSAAGWRDTQDLPPRIFLVARAHQITLLFQRGDAATDRVRRLLGHFAYVAGMNIILKSQAHQDGQFRADDAEILFHLPQDRFSPEVGQESQPIADAKGGRVKNIDKFHA